MPLIHMCMRPSLAMHACPSTSALLSRVCLLNLGCALPYESQHVTAWCHCNTFRKLDLCYPYQSLCCHTLSTFVIANPSMSCSCTGTVHADCFRMPVATLQQRCSAVQCPAVRCNAMLILACGNLQASRAAVADNRTDNLGDGIAFISQRAGIPSQVNVCITYKEHKIVLQLFPCICH